jgi:DNA-binding NtrC family response regulator
VITIATRDDSSGPTGSSEPRPGLLLVFSGRTPLLRPIPLAEKPLTLGREDAGGAPLNDDRMSRQHVRVSTLDGHLVVEDLGSRNGTFIDGVRIEGRVVADAPRVVRAGSTVLIPVRDVRAFLGTRIKTDGDVVMGPSLARALDAIAAAGISGDVALLWGESGAGKENAARVFHASTANANGPFVAVNCAAIPGTVAERLLFGAKRGAYSGATDDADGFCAAADGGTLFLDEVGELSLDVQAKLLRFLETQEFFPLGASKPRRVKVRVCCATHRDLRDAVGQGTFRGDLYYRLSTIQVRIPPLRERPEEIPWLIQYAVTRSERPIEVHATFVEACLRRPWPGNARELLGAVRRALHAAREGKLTAEHLDADAGMQTTAAPLSAASPPPSSGPSSAPSSQAITRDGTVPASQVPSSPAVPSSAADAERLRIADALQRSGGNQTRAAELLGISRRTFIRRLEELDMPRPRGPRSSES